VPGSPKRFISVGVDHLDEIISLLDAENISLILMSSHGKGLLTELLVGSTTLGVAIRINRSLMIIHTPGKPRN
jgi:nucleotide-binding universal stress UspA family protein